ncbi:aminotransferase class V-fold PLP-dependent enzyme [Subtercola vilae]|uniref:Aminotransferase class V-fold PLP-dependent enzyme n=2 Tax=Microbacteriaceae TaxID=85023 RepID=A0A4T2C453_9MICO|nr:aminotransferase class V-fold PLP-dependent enzyme [Subtercola vilae]
MATAVRGAVGASDRMHAEDLRARAAFARLSGFAFDAVSLIPHTSLGLFQVAFGIDRGTVLIGRSEFPANLYPWLRAAEIGLSRARLIGAVGQNITPSAIAEALAETPDVTAVTVSAVDFRSGFRADLAGIREAIGPDRLLIVDAIQGFGIVEMPWSLADALVVGGQKWLRAGWGAGALAFSGAGLERIRPVLGGWTGVLEPSRYDGAEHPVRPDALRFGISNLSPFATGSFATALELVEAATVSAIEARIADGVDALLDALDDAGLPAVSPRERSRRAGIVALALPGRAPAAHRALAERGITTTLHGDDRIRLAVHATTEATVFETVAETLGEYV